MIPNFSTLSSPVADDLRKRTAGIGDDAVNAEYGSARCLERSYASNSQWRPGAGSRTGPLMYGGGAGGLQALLKHSCAMCICMPIGEGCGTRLTPGVAQSFTEAGPAIVVAAFARIRVDLHTIFSERIRRRLNIPLFVTVGCPLAIRAVRSQFAPIGFPQPPVVSWNNASDPRDIVALYPSSRGQFPGKPAMIIDYRSVNNHTDNRHGI